MHIFSKFSLWSQGGALRESWL